jgi:hypothetical protein
MRNGGSAWDPQSHSRSPAGGATLSVPADTMTAMDTGATIPPWSGRRAQAALAAVKANGAANRTPCVLCGKPINYTLVDPHPMSCTVQHTLSRKHHPERTWDPTNWAPAHKVCNQQAGPGPRVATVDVGPTSQTW